MECGLQRKKGHLAENYEPWKDSNLPSQAPLSPLPYLFKPTDLKKNKQTKILGVNLIPTAKICKCWCAYDTLQPVTGTVYSGPMKYVQGDHDTNKQLEQPHMAKKS